MPPAAKLKGHKASVCCVRASEEEHIAVTGAEDGSINTFDLRSHSLVSRVQVAAKDAAVPSVVLHPKDTNLLYCCSDEHVYCLDRRQGGTSAACVQQFQFNSSEVNCVAINAKGSLLAAADDSGQIAIIDLAAGSLVRMLRGGHDSLASTVAFREHRPWEVISGGLDACIVRWDFSRGKPLRRWKLDQEHMAENLHQVCNPPFLHGIATPNNAEQPFGRVFAAARGDGAVAVYEADANSPKRDSMAGSLASPSQPTFCTLCHSAAVNHVSFPESGKGRLILSGGNDGRIILQDWTQNLLNNLTYRTTGAQTVEMNIEHGRKINSLANFQSCLNVILVADVTRNVSVYALQ